MGDLRLVRGVWNFSLLAGGLWLSACCGSTAPTVDGTDAGPEGGDCVSCADADVPEVPLTCGDGVPDLGEDCDDGNQSNDDFCLDTCRFACGDGVVNAVELCDTAIAAGSAGACPISCDDGDPCTTDTLGGATCLAVCSHGAITGFVDGDGCCPAGGDATVDADCPAVCDNGVVEPTETCDPSATCPTACDDGSACTTDTLTGSAATCDAACAFDPIVACASGDGCCPTGCTVASDADCSAVCGNGVIDTGETCDPPATCPSSCDDGVACTTDSMSGSAANCNVACTFTPIVAPAPGDGCCPPGANALTDSDCAPACGNSAVEPPETCDDGNTTPGDGCSATCQTELVPTVFRMSDLDLRDPHVWVDAFGCRDVTDTAFFGFSVNGALQDNVTMDGDADGLLDLSFLLVFRPLDQTVPGGGPLEFVEGDCTAPMAGTTCDLPAGAMPQLTTYTNLGAGTCLDVLPGTVRPYSPAVATPGAPCFSSDAIQVVLTVGGAVITLRGAQLGATYVGSPAASLSNGLVRGFLTEADANAATLDPTLPLIGGNPLSSVLRGGAGNCASGDDRDMGPDGAGGMTTGWWFYLNFPATRVTYIGP